MTYEEFTEGIGQYRELFDKGLKKQANKLLFKFTDDFRENTPTDQADEILYKFCADYSDDKFPPSALRGTSQIPFQLSELLADYFSRGDNFNKMPQMRWCFEFFGNYYDPERQENRKDYNMLKRIYSRPDCDQKTVNYYFNDQIDILYWGSHHFPEGCIITRETYYHTVKTAEEILSSHEIDDNAVSELHYYIKLYECYFQWSDNGRQGDFEEYCQKFEMDFTPIQAYYYK